MTTENNLSENEEKKKILTKYLRTHQKTQFLMMQTNMTMMQSTG